MGGQKRTKRVNRMKPMRVISSAILAASLLAGVVPARAQLGGPILPLPTTLVLEKPAPDQGYGKKQTITVGVSGQTYKFILRDAYVDDPSGKFHWDDIWRSVRQFRPNFAAQGTDNDTFEKIKPGNVVTVTGMYLMSTRTFEVTTVTPGAGPFAPKESY